MKIKMNNLSAGPDGVMQADGVYDVEPEKAQALVDAGFAVKVDEVKAIPVIETATISAPENQDLFDKLTKLKGGYYELPDGSKVKGKVKAAKALVELEQADDATGDEDEENQDADDGAE